MSFSRTRAPQEYCCAHGDVSGRAVISFSPDVKMKLMSQAGRAATPGRGPLPLDSDAGGPLGPKKSGAIAAGPMRPPDRLSQPSTLSLKKSVQTMRFDVMPPCECPTSQNDLIDARPTSAN